MFISFEGGEGSGKTTIIEKIEKILKDKHDVVVTREPGGSLISERLREIILDKKHTMMTPYTEALLYAASRTQHLDEVILPALKQNKIVICDRYVDSSLAYQAYARNLGFDYVIKINDYAMQNLPNITFYIDVDPKIGMDRIKNRTKSDRLDVEKMEFHEKVREGYLKVSKMFPKRVITINGNNKIEDVLNDILKHIKI